MQRNATSLAAFASPGLIALVALTGLSGLKLGCAAQPRPFVAQPIVWNDDDRQPIAQPEAYWSPMYWDAVDQTLFEPIDRALLLDIGGRARNVNAVGGVPNSSWFTNRLGHFDMTPEELAQGPCPEVGINEGGLWHALSGKVDGANPGFVIKDTTDGRMYLLKFDSAKQPERATSADVLGSKVYWAFGFSTPCNQVVHFSLENLQVGPNASKKDSLGNKTALTEQDVAAAMAGAPRIADGRIRGSASLFLPGEVLGPFRYHGTREDDFNDVIVHEDRRELRGARILAAWLNHFDAREQNTLTTFVADDETGLGYVQHHYIDFGDCLGSEWDNLGMSKRLGHSYYFDFGHVVTDFVTLGAIERPWDRAHKYDEGSIFGYFDVANFVPSAWKVAYYNPAFNRMDREDAFWAAAIISRFSDAHLDALVQGSRLTDATHARYINGVLRARRDAIVRAYLYGMSSFDRPHIDAQNQALCVEDLLVSRGYESAADSYYRARLNDHPWYEPEVNNPGTLCVPLKRDAQRAEVVVEASVRRTRQRDRASPVRFHLHWPAGSTPVLVGVER